MWIAVIIYRSKIRMDKNILYKYFEGNALPEEISKIRKWTEESDENKKEFYHERKLFDSIILLGKIHADTKERHIFLYNKVFQNIAKIAAIALLTIVITLFVQYESKNERPISLNTITVPVGQRVNLVLADGTSLWLNACSTFKYPSEFNDKTRDVILDGEAYFEVAHNKKVPFIVHTEKCNVKVLGTKFNVEAYSKNGSFETSLIQGSVNVTVNGDKKHPLLLVPGTKATLKKGKLVSSCIEDYDTYRWKDGLICFKNMSFRQIMNKLEKNYNVKIEINNKEALKYIGTGKFRQTDGLDYALNVLQKEIKFSYSKNNDVLYIN